MKQISYIDDFKKWSTEFIYSIPIKVRFSETDLYGHVNNTSVFVYFEEARVDYLQSLDIFSASERYGFVVSDLQSDYLSPMFFDDKIKLYVKVATIGRTSIDLHYMAKNQKDVVTVTGRGRLVMINLETNKSSPIPNEMRIRLENEISNGKNKPTF